MDLFNVTFSYFRPDGSRNTRTTVETEAGLLTILHLVNDETMQYVIHNVSAATRNGGFQAPVVLE